MAGENAAIWEVQSGAANGTEATATTTHTQLFNSTGKVISEGAYIDTQSMIIGKATPENEAVNDDNNEIQDMGLTGVDVIITGVAGDIDNEVATNLVTKFIKWSILDGGNTTTGFTKGRFGLRLDNAPQWNVVPTSTYGYHIIGQIEFNYVGDAKDQVQFKIRLGLGGDIVTALTP